MNKLITRIIILERAHLLYIYVLRIARLVLYRIQEFFEIQLLNRNEFKRE